MRIRELDQELIAGEISDMALTRLAAARLPVPPVMVTAAPAAHGLAISYPTLEPR